MMRSCFIFVTLVLLLTCVIQVQASPIIDGRGVCAYIGWNNYLYLNDLQGKLHVLEVPTLDLLSMDRNQVYALEKTGEIYGIFRNGRGSRIISLAATTGDITKYKYIPKHTLVDGILQLYYGKSLVLDVAHDVILATHDDAVLYFVKNENGKGILHAVSLRPYDGRLRKIRSLAAVPLNLISMNKSDDGITFVDTERSVILYQMSNRAISHYPAISKFTDEAVFINNILFRYTLDLQGFYHVEKAEDLFNKKILDDHSNIDVHPNVSPQCDFLHPSHSPSSQSANPIDLFQSAESIVESPAPPSDVDVHHTPIPLPTFANTVVPIHSPSVDHSY